MHSQNFFNRLDLHTANKDSLMPVLSLSTILHY